LSIDLDDTIQTLDTLQHELIERMSDYAPSFNHLSESLGLIRQWFDAALKQQLQSADSSIQEASGDKSGESASSPNFASHTSQTNASRDAITEATLLVDQSLQVRADAYRQLTEAANVLQRLEPHSPIPYMVHRAVQMGQMPFPKLMSQWVKEESTLDMFCRELGLSSIDDAKTRDEE